MSQILAYLAEYCSFLWTKGFRIVDSGTSTGFGDAYVRVESSAMRLSFSRERGKLFLIVQGTVAPLDTDWHSIDLIRRWDSGQRQMSAVLDEDYARYLGERIDYFVARFGDARRAAELHRELQDVRSAYIEETTGRRIRSRGEG